MKARNSIKGVVGSILVEHQGSSILLVLTFDTNEELEIRTTREELVNKWIPALCTKEFKTQTLAIKDATLEITIQVGITYIQPGGNEPVSRKPQIIISKSQT